MNPITYLLTVIRILWAERRKPTEEEAERVRRSVKNVIRARRLKRLSDMARR